MTVSATRPTLSRDEYIDATADPDNFQNIPKELRETPRWINWKYKPDFNETKKEWKVTKIPSTPEGQAPVSSKDPANYVTFDVAVEAYRNERKQVIQYGKHGVEYFNKIAGIGFAFNGDGIMGIDLDNALLTDGTVDPAFAPIFNAFESTYRERSPSGTGVHVIMRCKSFPYETGKVQHWFDDNGVKKEVAPYATDRFFTFTGLALNSVNGQYLHEYDSDTVKITLSPWFEKTASPPTTQTPRPKTSASNLDDNEVIEKASNSKHGDDFQRLYDGKWEGDYPSQSEADFALASTLAWWTGKDANQIERLMWASGLTRDKWSTRKGYLSRTIQNAIKKQTDVYEPFFLYANEPLLEDIDEILKNFDKAFEKRKQDSETKSEVPTKSRIKAATIGVFQTNKKYSGEEAIDTYAMALAYLHLGITGYKSQIRTFADDRCDPPLTTEERDAAIQLSEELVEAVKSGKVKSHHRENDKKPSQLISTDLDIDGDNMVHHLLQWNNPPKLFSQGGTMVQFMKDEHGTPSFIDVSEKRLRGIFARIMNFFIESVNDEGVASYKKIDPPLDRIGEVHSRFDIPLAGCKGIVRCPIMRPDGSLSVIEGYDPESKFYYSPANDNDKIVVPDNPTAEDVKRALAVIDEVFCDFPFKDAASRDNTLAHLLTAILRPLIQGCVPLFLINKPQSGSGASYIARLVGNMFLGEEPSAQSYTKNEEENRKRITGLLKAGTLYVFIDNVENATIDDPNWEALITSRKWSDRILGANEHVTFLNETVIVATGISIQIGRSMPRRCFSANLTASASKQWRVFNEWKHPDIFKWILQVRCDVLGAIFTIARYWIQAGRPIPTHTQLPIVGGFDEWRNIIGGMLLHASTTDDNTDKIGANFLQNLDAMYDSYDRQTPELLGFFHAIFVHFKYRPIDGTDTARALTESRLFTINSLADAIMVPRSEIAKTLPTAVSDAWEKDKLNHALGNVFRYNQERNFGTDCYRLIKYEEKEKEVAGLTHGQQKWFIRRNAPEPASEPKT